VRVTIDGTRDDGESGEDLVAVDMENVRGGAANDTLEGSASANRIEGGAGHDVVDGGAGRDDLRGGDGDDVVRARGDGPDTFACGGGTDLAVLDGLDSPADAPPERCERTEPPDRPARSEPLMTPTACAPAVVLPGMSRTVVLRDPLHLPAGAVVDTSSCPVALALPGGKGGARVAGGAARVHLRRGGGRATLGLQLTRAGSFRCSAGSRSRRIGALTVTAHGAARVRVRGRFSTAHATRAQWTTEDRCGATLTRVRAGTVAVEPAAGGRARIARPGRLVLVRGGGA
jgi:Ca2+-binding RTX toxin-like protein